MPATAYQFTAADIVRKLECQNPKCLCHRAAQVGYGRTHCPCHGENGDDEPSLSVIDKAGTTLWRCRAGCDQAVVTDAVKALFADGVPAPQIRIPPRTNGAPPVAGQATAKEYRYGEHIHYRLDPPDGKKRMWWSPGSKMSELGLYNSELLDERPTEEVLFVEGEKTADAGVSCGFLTVTNAGGASQRDFGTALEKLAGRNVILIPDLDDPGRKLMEVVASEIAKSAASIRIGSVADFIQEKGADLADLLEQCEDDQSACRPMIQAVIDSASPWSPKLKTLLFDDAISAGVMVEPPPRTWLVQDILPDRWPVLLFGDGGSGKTTLSNHLAIHLAIGRSWLDHKVTQVNPLIVDAELDEEEAARRLFPLARGMGLERPPDNVYYWRMAKAISNEDVLQHIEDLIARHRIGLVIVDSLTIATHMSDQNLATDLLKLIFALQKMGVPFLFIDHHAKSIANGDPDNTSPYGSVYKRNAVRSMIYMQTGNRGSARLHCRKSNFGPKWEPFSIAAEWLGFHPAQSIVYSRLMENDPRNLAMKSEEVKNETLEALRVLADEYPEGVETEKIAAYLSEKSDTIRMRLMRLEKTTPPKAHRVDRGKWLPINEPPPTETNK